MDREMKKALNIPHNTGVKGVRRESIRRIAFRDMSKANLSTRFIDLEKNIILSTQGLFPKDCLEWI